MFNNAHHPNTLLLATPGLTDFETLHLITAVREQQMYVPYLETDSRSTPPSEGEVPMTHKTSTIRELAIPLAIFISFFALPIYIYVAITA